MNRTGLIIGLAVLILFGALGYFWFERAEPGTPIAAQVELAKPPETQAVPVPQPESAPSPVISQAPKPAPEPQAAPAPKQDSQEAVARAAPQEPAPAVQATEEPVAAKPSVETREVAPPRETGLVAVLPSFDVVRVEPSGEAVVAGRATPGSTVRLIDGTLGLAEVLTNENGEWVIVLREPLAPGAHELSLESRLTSGEILLSENIVVLNVPAPALVAKTQPPPAAAPVPPAAAPAPPAAASAPEIAEPVLAQAPPAAAPAPATQTAAPAPAKAHGIAAPDPAPAVESAETSGSSASPVPEPASASPAVETLRPLAVLMPRSGMGAIRIIQAPEPVPRNLGDKALLLETVDYDDRGRAVIGGRGAAGAVLLLYLDDRPAGRAVVGAAGRWRAQLDGEVPFGVHSLRIDQVNETGKVVARVESPFSRANLVAAVGDEMAVIVQPGNSLWRIARRIYGQGVRYSVIYAANQNQIGDPDLIYPGQIFMVPAQN